MNNINERIREVRRHFCKDSNIEFSKKLGKSENTTSNYIRDGYNIGKGVAYEISTVFNVNFKWLMNGEGDMLIVPPTSTAEPQTHLNNMDNFTQLLQAIIRHGEEISEHRRLLDRAMSIVEQQQAERMPATSGVLATAVRDSQNPPPLRNESK